MQNEPSLYSQLKKYVDSGIYPMHMPGHKRRLRAADNLPYGLDLTETGDLDDLHRSEGILARAMERSARLRGAGRTRYLVNGSTCGVLAAIRALAPPGSSIIAARNCHKSVYRAVELCDLNVRWITPPVEKDFGIFASVSPDAVEEALKARPGASCAVITSPTYEGVVSDVSRISSLCRAAGVPLVVDEAHGAHFGFAEGFPQSAVRLGADLVVQSAHKTLLGLTQTAFLHICAGSSVDPDEVDRQLDAFETSSPSYPLLTSLDACDALLAERGEELFNAWLERLSRFDEAARSFKNIRVLRHGADRFKKRNNIFDFDPGKITISLAAVKENARGVAKKLFDDFGFETEAAWGDIIIAMTGLGDEKEAVERFAAALKAIDGEVKPARAAKPFSPPAPGESVFTAAGALRRPARAAELKNAVGEISGEYLEIRPPGVPLIAPGERVTSEFISAVEALEASGTPVRRSHSKKSGYMLVLT